LFLLSSGLDIVLQRALNECWNGVPDRTRTYYLKFRKLALYPDELPGLFFRPLARGDGLGNIARSGIVAAFLLVPAFARAECGPDILENVRLEKVNAEGDLLLYDGRKLRLAGLHLVRHEALGFLKPGESLAIGLLGPAKDRWSRLQALVFVIKPDASPEWVQERLIREGAALARPEEVLRDCWPVLTRIEAGLGKKLVVTKAEGGRFMRAEGRVHRVSDGRTARFIGLTDHEGVRVTGMIQKRDLKRFSDRNVDVDALRGHVIIIRGVRNLRNPTIVPLNSADQIEIVR
jgi:hypothetical protein